VIAYRAQKNVNHSNGHATAQQPAACMTSVYMSTRPPALPLLRQTNMAADIITSGYQTHTNAGCQNKLRFIDINGRQDRDKYLTRVTELGYNIDQHRSNNYIQL